MKKVYILLFLILPFVSFAKTEYIENGGAVYIHSDVPVCVVSLKIENFTYNPELIELAVPEYDNATTATAGIPQCQTDFLFGYSTSTIESGFAIGENQNFISMNNENKN